MKTLVIADVRKGTIRKSTWEVLSEACRLSSDVEVALIGHSISDDEAQKAAHFGALKIHVVDQPEFQTYVNTPFIHAAKTIVESVNPRLVILPTSESIKDFVPGLAQKTGASAITDCCKIEIKGDAIQIERPLMAAKVRSSMETSHSRVILTVRAGSFDVSEPDTSKTAEVVKVSVEIPELKQVLKEVLSAASGKLSLDEADIVIAAGRGCKDEAGIKLIEELADVLGAAVGSTRAVVESGLVSATLQIGQTGKVINPTLYIGCGVSGAVQHTAGMGNSKVIVAINKDSEAPIFNIADYGLVGDLFQVVPVLIQAVKELKAGN